MPYPEYEKLAASPAGFRSSSAATTLPVVEEEEASQEVAELYRRLRTEFGRPAVPGILKCFATHPQLLRAMMDLAQGLLFTDGSLSRCQKEMIATFVSAQNDCPYCVDSHGYFLRMHGGSVEALCALQQNNLDAPALSTAEKALLRFVNQVNRDSQTITRTDVEHLLHQGWTTLQIAEAVHIAALFAMFNRVANAFGLQAQGLLTLCGDRSSQP
jgi:uncharacterized peroxidase-related enzyme